MGVYIKGMSMPKNEELIIICSDGTVEMTNDDGCRVCEQKATELPPHGRLIDANELRGWYDFHSYDVDDDDFLTEEEFDKLMVATAVVRQNIDDAPTIIESEE